MPELLPQGRDGKDHFIKFQKYLTLSITIRTRLFLGKQEKFRFRSTTISTRLISSYLQPLNKLVQCRNGISPLISPYMKRGILLRNRCPNHIHHYMLKTVTDINRNFHFTSSTRNKNNLPSPESLSLRSG